MIRMISRKNATWQGKITWLNGSETRSFRSMLELIKLMNDVMEGENGWKEMEGENKQENMQKEN